jgi:hypothetical protein
VFNSSCLNISFRRALVGDNKLQELHNMVSRLVKINLQEDKDIFIWSLHVNGSFSVCSMYKYIVNSGIRVTQDGTPSCH